MFSTGTTRTALEDLDNSLQQPSPRRVPETPIAPENSSSATEINVDMETNVVSQQSDLLSICRRSTRIRQQTSMNSPEPKVKRAKISAETISIWSKNSYSYAHDNDSSFIDFKGFPSLSDTEEDGLIVERTTKECAASNATNSDVDMATNVVSEQSDLLGICRRSARIRQQQSENPLDRKVKRAKTSSEKISKAKQIEQMTEGKVDLKTPNSILTSVNLRNLLSEQSFSLLPPDYQSTLIKLLPSVDQEAIKSKHGNGLSSVPMAPVTLKPSTLMNEFYTQACLEWRDRLSMGEFTPRNQMELNNGSRSEVDEWKIKSSEPIWIKKSYSYVHDSDSSFSDFKGFERLSDAEEDDLKFERTTKECAASTTTSSDVAPGTTQVENETPASENK